MNIITEPTTSSFFMPLSKLPLDCDSISQGHLNIEDRKRTNLFPWNGQFSPQLIEVLMQEYGKKGHMVLDPFMGSGTVLHEAGRAGFAAFGSEINPAAFKFARTYSLINVAQARRKRLLQEVETALEDFLDDLPLFVTSKKSAKAESSLSDQLLARYTSFPSGQSKDLFESFLLLLDFRTKRVDSSRLNSIWERFKRTILELPNTDAPIKAANCDARDLDLERNQVDLVVTSPPYINVFNYHQQLRPSVEAMGWNLLEVARSEIGSNRKHRGNRLLTVTQYILDMTQVLREVCRVCKPDARIIYVVGRESNVRKTKFYNGEIVANLATSLGLTLERRQERVFKNRFGAMIVEDILHFIKPPKQTSESLELPRKIAKHVLETARKSAPQDCIADFNSAIELVGQTEPSPLYVPTSKRVFAGTNK